MGWNPFSRSDASQQVTQPPLGPNQIEQRSHQSVNLQSAGPSSTQPQSDISLTLEQITHDHAAPLQVTAVDLQKKPLDETVADFVLPRPDNLFIIDGEKDLKESIICTTNPRNGGKDCLKLKANSIELFKTMQKLEYFCSLPDDIDATYFECRKIK